MPEKIRVACPSCGKRLTADAKYAGRTTKCPGCQAPLKLDPEDAADLAPLTDAPPAAPVPAAVRRAPEPTPAVTIVAREAPTTTNVIVQQPPRRGASLGIASLVLGVVALVLCWIPIVGCMSIPLAVVGLLLAAIGLIVAIARGGAGIGYSIAGGVASAIGLAVPLAAVLLIGGSVTAIGQAAEEANRRAQATNQQVLPVAGEPDPDDPASASQPDTDAAWPVLPSSPAAAPIADMVALRRWEAWERDQSAIHPSRRPLELKGDRLGMTLEMFKARHYRVVEDKEGVSWIAPFCSDANPNEDNLFLLYRATNAKAGVVRASTTYPFEAYLKNPVVPTIAGVPANQYVYSFIDGRLYQILVTFSDRDHPQVMRAMQDKYGPPTTKTHNLTIWKNEVSSITIFDQFWFEVRHNDLSERS